MDSLDRSIELWTLPLAARAGDRELLAPRELRRVDRLVVDEKRAQLVAAQAGLRRVLAAYLGTPAAAVEFGYGEHGKPYLPAYPALRFNMTHSARVALVAVTGGVEIGVDLEWTGRERPFLRLARRYFTGGEAAWLAARSEAQQLRAFYRTWTLKEAYLKAVGTGLTVAPDRFELDLERSPATLRATDLPGDEPGAWSFAEPRVAADYAAAICWRSDLRELVPRDPVELAGVADR